MQREREVIAAVGRRAAVAKAALIGKAGPHRRGESGGDAEPQASKDK